MPGTHATLSPSSASRWLACTPSARVEETFAETSSSFADEGTLAHKLGELLISKELKRIKPAAYEKQIKEIAANKLFSAEMRSYADSYCEFVIERLNEARSRNSDALIFLEQRLDMTDYVPEGFGTGDVVIIADEVLDFVDLKYGKGVPVSAVENKQMMLYALGALKEFDYLYHIERVRMTIYQPRIDNISEWEIGVAELKQWAEEVLKPKAAMAFAGEGEFVAGNHCQFCRAKATCKALADEQLKLAQYEFKQSPFLTDDEVADILRRATQFEKWLKAVEDNALFEAVNNGKKWPGFKLVEGRSNRVITDPAKAAENILKAGFKEEDIFKPKVLFGLTELERVVTKKKFAELCGDLVIKPAGKPALVTEDDKRPELNSLEGAKMDFAVEVETED